MAQNLQQHHAGIVDRVNLLNAALRSAARDGYRIEAELLPGEPSLGVAHPAPVLHLMVSPPATTGYDTPVMDRSLLPIAEYRQQVTDRVRRVGSGFVFPVREGMMATARRYLVADLAEIPADASHVVWYDL